MQKNQASQFNKLVGEIGKIKTDIQTELSEMQDDIIGIKNTI